MVTSMEKLLEQRLKTARAGSLAPCTIVAAFPSLDAGFAAEMFMKVGWVVYL